MAFGLLTSESLEVSDLEKSAWRDPRHIALTKPKSSLNVNIQLSNRYPYSFDPQ